MIVAINQRLETSRRRKECQPGHLGQRLVSQEGRWLNETEPLDWNNYECVHCGAKYFHYVNSFGEPKGNPIYR